MRNKVLYKIVIFISIFLAYSCDRIESDEILIGFEDIYTKAFVSSESDLRYGGIGILGVMTNNSTSLSSALFPNTFLFYSGGWTYDEPKYWIPGNTFDFVAIFPYDGSVSPYYRCDIPSKSIEFSYTSSLPSLANSQKEVMFSYHHRVYTEGGDHSPVPLLMQHACSSLNFQVQNSSEGVISISDIYLTGLYNNGSCVLNANSSWNATATWTVTHQKVAIDNATIYPGKTSGLSNISVSANYYEMFSESLIVVPQDVENNTDIILHATITPTSGAPYDISAVLANTTSVTEWEPGNHYVYQLTIASTYIIFDVKLQPWIDEYIEL